MNYVTGIFALLIGTLGIWIGTKMILLYFKVKNWTIISAKIMNKEIFEHAKFSSSFSKFGISVNYVFQFNSKEYNGNKVYLVELINGQTNHLKKTAEKKLSVIKDSMNVYVNPENPNESVLFCTGIGLNIIVVLMGLFSVLFGLVTIIN